MTAYKLYCDEAGNTGPNFIDQNQPIYVLAGLLVPSAAEPVLDAAIQTARRTGAQEVASARMLDSESGCRRLEGALKKLEEAGCVPVYVIFEKRFGVAGKIVETFLDPFYNPLIGNEWTWPSETKIRLARHLHELPDAVLNEFARAYRALDPALLDASLSGIQVYLGETGHGDIAVLMGGSRPKIGELASTEATLTKGQRSINFMGSSG